MACALCQFVHDGTIVVMVTNRVLGVDEWLLVEIVEHVVPCAKKELVLFLVVKMVGVED